MAPRTLASKLTEKDQEGPSGGLHGPVPQGASTSYGRMAPYLGLTSAKAVKAWMASPAFKPCFDELCKDHIIPAQQLAKSQGRTRPHGPLLNAVQLALKDGEALGDERYSSYYELDKTDWSDVDHYALCLFRLKKLNMDNRDGIFRSKVLPPSDMESRLWMAIMKASYEMAESRQPKEKSQFPHLLRVLFADRY
jgi:alkylated DNA nucleotide flippase Atl1